MHLPRVAVATAAAAVIAVGGGAVVARSGRPPAAPAAAATSPSPAPVPSLSSPPAATPPRVAAPAARPAYPLPAGPVRLTGCPPPPRKPTTPKPPWRPAVVVPESALPVALPPATGRATDLAAVRGKGFWVYQWDRTEGGSAARVVARAKASGLDSVWVRTGSSRSGFYGAAMLRDVLPAAHRAGLKVVAWDFPYLYDPVADAARAAATLAYRAPSGDRIDAFSPDVESRSEGTQATRRRVQVYLGLAQRAAGARPLVTTVPHPTDHWLRVYDYAAQAPYVDAFAVMAYWGCVEPGRDAARSIARLARYGRPLHLVGQAFDLGPYGGRVGSPTGREVWRFSDVARRGGAVGVSLYVWQHATREQFRALAAYPWT